MLRDKQLKNAEHDLIEAMCLYEQYHSPACWMTTSAAFPEYNKLTTKKGPAEKGEGANPDAIQRGWIGRCISPLVEG